MFHESRLSSFFDSRSLRCSFNILKNSYSIVSQSPPLSCPPAFIVKAAAKVMLIFQPPNFFKLFSKLFSAVSKTSRPSISFKLLPSPALSLESGCKDKRRNSLFPNFFNNIFKVFYNRLDCNTLKIPWPAILEGMYTGCPGKQPTKDQPPAKQKRSPTSMPRSWFVHDSSMVATIQQERLDKRQGSLITNA